MQIGAVQSSGGGGGGGRGGEASETCSSSSIGKASESVRFGSDGGPGEPDEVQSPYKGPLGALHALEESLPIRRGISRFYDGRSKSFGNLITSLSPTNSCKDLAKTENPYTRKRKNLLAFSLMYQRYQPKEPAQKSDTRSTASNSDSESNASDLEEDKTPLKRVKSGMSVFEMHQRSVYWTDY